MANFLQDIVDETDIHQGVINKSDIDDLSNAVYEKVVDVIIDNDNSPKMVLSKTHRSIIADIHDLFYPD